MQLQDEAGELSAVELVDAEAEAPLLIICDHASNRIPPHMGRLGLPPAELGRHIAWDIGAASVCRRLVCRLGATAVMSTVSRLVIDCNRPPGHPTSICSVSDGTTVPGNQDLSSAEVASRTRRYFRPYHEAIRTQLNRLEKGGDTAMLVAIHSFTPVLGGQARPWEVGILWNRDPRLALPLIDALRADCGYNVGDNEPYSGRNSNYTVDLHGDAYGRPHVSIEIRQDQISDEAGAQYWGDLLAELLACRLADPTGRRRRLFPPVVGRLAG